MLRLGRTDQGPARRTRVVSMSLEQHVPAMEIGEALLKGLGYDNPALGAILVEAMANMSPAMSMSQYAIAQALANEAERYEADPAQYLAMSEDTAYEVLALVQPPIEGLGQVPDYFARAWFFPHEPSMTEDWLEFAMDIEGFEIAKLLGLTLEDIAEVTRERGAEKLVERSAIVDLRLALFYEAINFPRGADPRDAPGFAAYIESLLHALDVAHKEYIANAPAGCKPVFLD